MKSSLWAALRTLVFVDEMLGEEVPLERERQRGVTLKFSYFTAIGSPNVKTVADRHRLAAYHNKHL